WTAARSSIPAAVTQWTRRRCDGRWPFEADDEGQACRSLRSPANARSTASVRTRWESSDPSSDMSQTANKPVEVGVVLQGGGALGAYECGALNALLELIDEFSAKGHRILLKVVSGVSIGSINAACVVGAKSSADARARLNAMWDDLMLETPPFRGARGAARPRLFRPAGLLHPSHRFLDRSELDLRL